MTKSKKHDEHSWFFFVAIYSLLTLDSSGDTESMLDEQEDFEFQDETKTIISIFKTENESVLVPVNVIKICSNSSKSNHNIKTITFEEGSQLESLEPYAFSRIENL